jgi:pyrroline-5-carboxylate reductase
MTPDQAAAPSPATNPAGAPSLSVVIYGCGKMVEAMLARWVEAEALSPREVTAVVRRPQRADELRQRYGITTTLDASALRAADIVVLGVKPQQLDAVAPSIRSFAQPHQLWISVLAGTPLANLHARIPARWQRWMPNTPCRLGLGATAVCGEPAPPETMQRLGNLLRALGESHPLLEPQIDAFTAVAGSGPAYVFAFVEALAEAARAQGIGDDQANRLARAVVVGAAGLLQADPRDAAALRTDVTSPGGTTEAALRTLAAHGWSQAMVAAIGAGVSRARVLAGTEPADPASTANR